MCLKFLKYLLVQDFSKQENFFCWVFLLMFKLIFFEEKFFQEEEEVVVAVVMNWHWVC